MEEVTASYSFGTVSKVYSPGRLHRSSRADDEADAVGRVDCVDVDHRQHQQVRANACCFDLQESLRYC